MAQVLNFKVNKERNQKIKLNINGVTMTLVFAHNKENNHWNLTIARNNTPLIAGITITTGYIWEEYDMLEQYEYLDIGKIYVNKIDTKLDTLTNLMFTWVY